MNDSLNQVLEMLLKAVESVNASDCNTTDSVCELAKQGLIPVGISNRHVHLSNGVYDGQIVRLAMDGPRGGIMDNVIVRANEQGSLECHIDTEEANAYGINAETKLKLIK